MPKKKSYFTEGVVIDRSPTTIFIVEGEDADPSIPYHKNSVYEAGDPNGQFKVGDFVSYYVVKANNKNKREVKFLDYRWK